MRLGYHKVKIKGNGAVFVQLAHKISAESVVLNEYAVHYVDVKIFDPALLKRAQLGPEIQKIRTHERGGYLF